MRTIECTCIICGKAFVYSSAASRGCAPKTCSEECKRENRKKHYSYKKIGLHKVTTKCSVCGKVFTYEKTTGKMRKACSRECNIIYIRTSNRERYTYDKRKKYTGNCIVCGKPFITINRSTITCGRSCGKRLSDKTRSINASNRRFARTGKMDDSDLTYRRTRAEWKRRGDKIEREEVFERDGWRCYICKDETPKSLIGTNHPKAPEVDHVVPFAHGGRHVWSNVMCSCRSCNSEKRTELTDLAKLFMSVGLF